MRNAYVVRETMTSLLAETMRRFDVRLRVARRATQRWIRSFRFRRVRRSAIDMLVLVEDQGLFALPFLQKEEKYQRIQQRQATICHQTRPGRPVPPMNGYQVKIQQEIKHACDHLGPRPVILQTRAGQRAAIDQMDSAEDWNPAEPAQCLHAVLEAVAQHHRQHRGDKKHGHCDSSAYTNYTEQQGVGQFSCS